MQWPCSDTPRIHSRSASPRRPVCNGARIPRGTATNDTATVAVDTPDAIRMIYTSPPTVPRCKLHNCRMHTHDRRHASECMHGGGEWGTGRSHMTQTRVPSRRHRKPKGKSWQHRELVVVADDDAADIARTVKPQHTDSSNSSCCEYNEVGRCSLHRPVDV